MLDIKFVRENPDIVKQNIKNKFQDEKLPLVDEVIELYGRQLKAKQDAEALQASRNALSKADRRPEGQGQEGAGEGRRVRGSGRRIQAQVTAESEQREQLEKKEADELAVRVRDHDEDPQHHRPQRAHRPGRLLQCGGSALRRGQSARLRRALPRRHHGAPSTALIMTSARRVSGTGFYYLLGDIARLHEAVLAYARDFMINKGFTYVIPPYMIRGEMGGGRHVLPGDGRHDV